MLKTIYTLAMATLISGTVMAQESHYHVIKKDSIGGTGGWDYLFANPANQRLYVSHSTEVEVLNLKTGVKLATIKPTPGVHGVATIDAMNRGYISNGRSDNVSVFDLKSNQILKTIATGKDPDAIFYDDFNGMIITCNGHSDDLSFIDPKTEEVVATVAVGGKPETAVSDGKGHVFVNIEDKSEVVKINSKTHEVEAHWKLAKGEEPTGLVIDRAIHRLMVACGGSPFMEVLDTETGKSLFQIPIGRGCDGAAFDAQKKLFFASNGEGTLTIIKEINANDFKVVQTLATARGARTITIDPKSHHIFVSSALFQAGDQGRRPVAIPDSFFVMEIGE